MVQTIDIHQLKKILESPNKKLAVVDVRALWEWESGHIQGAIHLPLSELEERRRELLAFDTIYFYCQSGGRSHVAAEIFHNDVSESINVNGGIAAWKLAGYPIV